MGIIEFIKKYYDNESFADENGSDILHKKAIDAVKNKKDVLIGGVVNEIGYIKVFKAKDAEVLLVEGENIEIIHYNGEIFWNCRILKKVK